MSSIAFEVILCALAFWFGYSANQGGTCLVVAADELRRRRPPRMFVGFLAASAAAGLVALPLVWSGALGGALAASTDIHAVLLVGAAAFGFGALVNDTCLLGSLARLGDGEIRLLALPPGLALGIIAVDHVMPDHGATWPSILSTPSLPSLVAVGCFAIAMALSVGFVSMKRFVLKEPRWSFAVSMIGLGAAGGALYALSPSWTISSLIQHGLPLTMSPMGEVALLAALSSITGALVASYRKGNLRLRLPSAHGILRSLLGGTLMGVGIALVPGGNDALIFSAMPGLSPGGIAAYLVMTATIVLGLVVSAKLFGSNGTKA
ncbi:YeeE/YedE thiosulfate transporter family protein [Devosia sp.]|uniref:YeeE/YedE thiosulfate transporter family protein n=1 Tax=Devosia sp. TaxID=1871048 RepID=UPI0019ED470F|nr:YeeE/YedE thiosulfate transporter family protein [Devosia sp.]MBE0579927.1 YeeE/YedE family protein [Devosia sp.]